MACCIKFKRAALFRIKSAIANAKTPATMTEAIEMNTFPHWKYSAFVVAKIENGTKLGVSYREPTR